MLLGDPTKKVRKTGEYFTVNRQLNKKIVEFLRTFNDTKQYKMLENEGGIDVFLPRNFGSVLLSNKSEGFDTFKRNHSINLIWITPNLLNDWRLNQDVEWQLFFKDYSSYGFKRIKHDSEESYLIIEE